MTERQTASRFFGHTGALLRYALVGAMAPGAHYALLVVFHQALPGVLSSLPIYIAVVCALFLRFEFMSKGFLVLFRLTEAGGLAYIITALIGYVGF